MKFNTNAKEEFKRITNGLKVISATIWKEEYDKETNFIDLLEGYGLEDYNKFLDKLDFSYDNGYGRQNLFGFIGCDNGIWFDREEYDGSEWWARHEYPNIDEIIKNRVLDKLEGLNEKD
jgi:hypothetical protein